MHPVASFNSKVRRFTVKQPNPEALCQQVAGVDVHLFKSLATWLILSYLILSSLIMCKMSYLVDISFDPIFNLIVSYVILSYRILSYNLLS